MNRTITFRELVKRIHPDRNPHITDAGSKMKTAVLYKNKPEELYKLAVRWGVMNGARPTPRPVPQVTRPRYGTPEPANTVRPRPQRPQRTTEKGWEAPQRPQPPPRARYRWQAFINVQPRIGDHVVVTTQDSARVQVVRVTPKRVYFFLNGKRTFASKQNVYVVKWVRVN